MPRFIEHRTHDGVVTINPDHVMAIFSRDGKDFALMNGGFLLDVSPIIDIDELTQNLRGYENADWNSQHSSRKRCEPKVP